jgi:tetratricopeptide (TPR) repeat protein/GTPase SAR1 family protein
MVEAGDNKEFQVLLRRMQEVPPVLFLGAGASMPVRAPSGKEFMELIKERFSELDFEGAGENLLDVCQYIEDEGLRVDLERFVKGKLYGLRPSKAHLAIPCFEWAAIFTTNYDTLVEDAYSEIYKQNPEKFRKHRSIVGNQSFTFRDDEVLVFKTMGCITYEAEPLILTRSDYNRNSRIRHKMFDCLADFARDRPIIYIGYSFRDRVAFEVIDEVIAAVGGPQKIAKAYAINPNIEEGSRIGRMLVRRNITPIKADFQTFMTRLQKGYRPPSRTRRPSVIQLRLRTGNVEIPYRDYQEFREYFIIMNEWGVHQREISATSPNLERVNKFFQGRLDSWEPYEKGWDFRRELYPEIKERVLKEMSQTKPEQNDSLLILGSGGLGKTTLLKRLAFDIYSADFPVIFLHNYRSSFNYRMISKFCEDVNSDEGVDATRSPNKVLIILDNADSNMEHVRKLTSYLRARSNPVLLVGAARTNEWLTAQSKWSFRGLIPPENTFELPQRMSDSEIDQLINHLSEVFQEDRFKQIDLLRAVVREKCKSDFFAALYSLVDPTRRPLAEIVADEYRKLPTPLTRAACEYVCLFSRYDLSLKLEMLVRPLDKEFGITLDEFVSEIVGTEAKNLIIECSGPYEGVFYRARNRVFAEKVLDYCYVSGFQEDIDKIADRYKAIITQIRSLDEYEVDVIRSLLVKHLGPNAKDYESFGYERLKRLYDAAIDRGTEDSTILHHYAIMEREKGHFECARDLLLRAFKVLKEPIGRRSLATEPRKNILNSLGVLYSLWAFAIREEQGEESSMAYFDTADEYFKASKQDDPSNSYPYHCRAISSKRRGDYYQEKGMEEEAYRFYAEALETIDEAKESVVDYELKDILALEVQIYQSRLKNFEKAREMLRRFIERHESAHAYFLLGKLLYEEAKNYRTSEHSRHVAFLDAARHEVEAGIRAFPQNRDLLRLEYVIAKALGGDKGELFEILVRRYKAFTEACTELELLFELAVASFELGKYPDSRRYCAELTGLSSNHYWRGGIKAVAHEPGDSVDKVFTGRVYRYQRRKASIKSKIGTFDFIPIREKYYGEIGPNTEVEFKVAFNYRGQFAIEVRPT